MKTRLGWTDCHGQSPRNDIKNCNDESYFSRNDESIFTLKMMPKMAKLVKKCPKSSQMPILCDVRLKKDDFPKRQNMT